MARLRFVHAADLHLDSPFRGIRSEAPPQVAEELHRATFEAYANIIALCLEERVDALLVAGDIYDGADRSLRAQLKFVDGLNRLDAAGIRSFICHGNHDPLDGWEARLDLPQGCVRYGREVTGEPVFRDEPDRAMVYGISYPTREMRENLAPLFATPAASGFGIGLLHANVGGNTDHDPYAPCSVSDLAETGLDYWALGHVHTRQVLREEQPTIVYPGNPQGRNPRETGERGIYLVEVNDYGAVSLDFRPVDVVRWDSLEVGIEGMETQQELLGCYRLCRGWEFRFIRETAGLVPPDADGARTAEPLDSQHRNAGRSAGTSQRPTRACASLAVVRADPGGHRVPSGPRACVVAGGLCG